ncbi:GNAT family N-acetyltransferase [Pseudorhodoferax sp. Leaf267]|uniref:GNAT family N-acetyltransferase n=1 Tax=Pseudorhodoferax sp. Leaf267 TaxID=1736316 RepID=UPI001F379926|nr:GNAT family N-acetyltransferase [Pseudorhodoferax sp. Leaf267]
MRVLPSFAALRTAVPSWGRGEAQGDLFLDLSWFELLAAHGLEHAAADLRLALVQPPVPAAPLCLPLLAAAGGLHSLSNYYSCAYGPIAPGADMGRLAPDTWRAVGRALRRLPQGATLRLQPLAEEDGLLQAQATGLRAAGYWVDRFFCFVNWSLPCAGLDFDTYLRGRHSRLRHNIERGRRRLDRCAAWGVEICQADDARLQPCLDDYEAVYAASWKQSEARPEFIRQLVRLLAREGSLRLGVLRVDGRALAAQLWWVRDGRACIYKLAYREDAARFSAGSVLSASLFRHAMDVDRVREIDYLSGDDAYKREWMSHRRERWGLVAFDPWRPAGLAAALRHHAGGAWRRLGAAFNRSGVPAP